MMDAIDLIFICLFLSMIIGWFGWLLWQLWIILFYDISKHNCKRTMAHYYQWNSELGRWDKIQKENSAHEW